jgi:cytochrome c
MSSMEITLQGVAHMKKTLVAILTLLLCAGGVHAAAGDTGSAKEAKAMVQKAVAYLKTNGPDVAFPAFSDPKGKFVDRDLYIWVADMNANMKCVAHGVSAQLVERDLMEFKDSDGKLFIREIYELAKIRGSGWVDYKWFRPATRKIEQKSVYFEKVDHYIVACGYYK